MAASYKNIVLKSYPVAGEKSTRDTAYWKDLEFPILTTEPYAPSSIHFSPSKPHEFAVTSGQQVEHFSADGSHRRTFKRFKDSAYCGRYRDDGTLVVAGGAQGKVMVYDLLRLLPLRTFTGHKAPVHVTHFTKNPIHIMSASDDKTAKICDITTSAEVIQYEEHKDYIRCGATSQASKDLFITGSYDHTVKLFDTRTSASVLTVDHKQPIEAVLMYPAGGLFLSAGANEVKVWDTLAGGKLLTTFTHHHKNIMDMCFCSDFQRILTASLDKHVKIMDVSTYEVVHTLDYSAPVLSIGVAPDDSMVAVGMADGQLSIQQRKTNKTTAPMIRKKKQYHKRLTDQAIVHIPKTHLTKYDKLFKQFKHSQALDAAFELRIKHPEVVVSVMLELIRRDNLGPALAGRSEKSIAGIIKFIQKHISNPKYSTVLVDVTDCLLDVYTHEIGQSSTIDEMLSRLKLAVDFEIKYMKTTMSLLGSLDTIIQTAQADVTCVQPNKDIEIPENDEFVTVIP